MNFVLRVVDREVLREEVVCGFAVMFLYRNIFHTLAKHRLFAVVVISIGCRTRPASLLNHLQVTLLFP